MSLKSALKFLSNELYYLLSYHARKYGQGNFTFAKKNNKNDKKYILIDYREQYNRTVTQCLTMFNFMRDKM